MGLEFRGDDGVVRVAGSRVGVGGRRLTRSRGDVEWSNFGLTWGLIINGLWFLWAFGVGPRNEMGLFIRGHKVGCILGK